MASWQKPWRFWSLQKWGGLPTVGDQSSYWPMPPGLSQNVSKTLLKILCFLEILHLGHELQFWVIHLHIHHFWTLWVTGEQPNNCGCPRTAWTNHGSEPLGRSGRSREQMTAIIRSVTIHLYTLYSYGWVAIWLVHVVDSMLSCFLDFALSPSHQQAAWCICRANYCLRQWYPPNIHKRYEKMHKTKSLGPILSYVEAVRTWEPFKMIKDAWTKSLGNRLIWFNNL